MSKLPLSWYEDNAAEIINNLDGSVTFVFDEPGPSESRTTVSKEEYEKAQKDPAHLLET